MEEVFHPSAYIKRKGDNMREKMRIMIKMAEERDLISLKKEIESIHPYERPIFLLEAVECEQIFFVKLL